MPQSSALASLPTPLNWTDGSIGAVNKGQVHDHLRNLSIHKYIGSNRMLPSVLKEFTDAVTKPLSMIFEECDSQVKSQETGKNEDGAHLKIGKKG